MTRRFISILFLAFCFSTTAQQFTLPGLKFKYSDLEPTIDSVTMRVHYSKHHAGYLKKLNAELPTSNTKSIEEICKSISTYSTSIRNNAGGYYNHSLFWEILSPKPNTKPSPEFEAEINKHFGSVEKLKSLLENKGSGLFGSGWVWLIVTPNKELVVCTTINQDNPLMDINEVKGIPILAIDVWEHAYYLNYQNKRSDYLHSLWEIIDWSIISEKFTKALQQ